LNKIKRAFLNIAEDEMKKMKKNILNIRNNYENLLLLSKESFATIKTKDYGQHKLVKELEKREFDSLNENKNILRAQLNEKAKLYGRKEMKIRDVIKEELTTQEEIEEIEEAVKMMIDKENEFRQQLKMTIEIAQVMYKINSDYIEGALEIAKKENIDRTGSMILEQDY
jgi:hypothetical protein